jgi:hypothetical protein
VRVVAKEINFQLQCSVFIIATVEGKEDLISLRYERPQYVDDFTLTEEAKINFEDMKSKKIENVKELVKIYIARNKEQFAEIEN